MNHKILSLLFACSLSSTYLISSEFSFLVEPHEFEREFDPSSLKTVALHQIEASLEIRPEVTIEPADEEPADDVPPVAIRTPRQEGNRVSARNSRIRKKQLIEYMLAFVYPDNPEITLPFLIEQIADTTIEKNVFLYCKNLQNEIARRMALNRLSSRKHRRKLCMVENDLYESIGKIYNAL